MSALTFKIGGDTLGLKKAVAGAKGALAGLAGAVDKVKVPAMAAGATAAMGAVAGAFQSVRKAADMEQLEIAFGVLTGSAKEGKKAIEDLMALSDRTPLDPEEVVNAGRSLLAFGVGADEVTKTLEMVGNVAQGIGAPLNDIAEIYGKAKVQGRLFGEDINQLTGRGIPVIGELAKVLGVTGEEVKGLVSAGQVGFLELEKAFEGMTGAGGQFSGMMAKQANSFNGMVSTLMGKVNAGLRKAGVGVMEALKPVVADLMAAVDSVGPVVARIGAGVGEAIALLVQAFKMGALPGLLKDGLILGGKTLINFLVRGFKGVTLSLLEGLKMIPDFFRAGLRVLTDSSFWKEFGSLLQSAFDLAINGIIQRLPSVLASDSVKAEAAALQEGLRNDLAYSAGRLGEILDSTVGEVGREAGANMAAGFARGFGGPDFLGTDEVKGRIEKTWNGISEALDEQKKVTEEATEAERKRIEAMEGAGEQKKNIDEMLKGVSGFMRPVVSSLGRVGGGTLRGAVNRIDVERNKILKKIEANTAEPVAAVYS